MSQDSSTFSSVESITQPFQQNDNNESNTNTKNNNQINNNSSSNTSPFSSLHSNVETFQQHQQQQQQQDNITTTSNNNNNGISSIQQHANLINNNPPTTVTSPINNSNSSNTIAGISSPNINLVNGQNSTSNSYSSSINNSPSSASPNFSSPYRKPLSLTKDRIPTHLQHYLESIPIDFNELTNPLPDISDGEDGDDIREVTPATITLRSLNQNNSQQQQQQPVQFSNNSNNNNATTTTTTTTTTNTSPQPIQKSRKKKAAQPTTQTQQSVAYNSNNNNFQDPNNSENNQQLATIPGNDILSLANVVDGDRSITRSGQSYIEITEFLNFPQSEAAKKLGIPTSTLSKRWKEAARGRKWPFRKVSKIDKEIMTLLHNIPAGARNPDLPPEVDASLVTLLKKRQDKLKPVFIRM